MDTGLLLLVHIVNRLELEWCDYPSDVRGRRWVNELIHVYVLINWRPRDPIIFTNISALADCLLNNTWWITSETQLYRQHTRKSGEGRVIVDLLAKLPCSIRRTSLRTVVWLCWNLIVSMNREVRMWAKLIAASSFCNANWLSSWNSARISASVRQPSTMNWPTCCICLLNIMGSPSGLTLRTISLILDTKRAIVHQSQLDSLCLQKHSTLFTQLYSQFRQSRLRQTIMDTMFLSLQGSKEVEPC